MLRSMLVAVLTAVVLPAAPVLSGSPTPQPSTAPLKTIANIRVSIRCAEIITHANSAITTTLDNDEVIRQTITRLRLTNLDDGNAIHRRNSLQALGQLANTLFVQSRTGDDEVKRLRAIAAKTKNPDDAKALKTFADQLGGALWDQQKVARDLNGFLAYVDFHDMAQGTEDERQALDATAPQTSSWLYHDASGALDPVDRHDTPNDPNNPTTTQQAQLAADDFQRRSEIILTDEDKAASYEGGAISHC